MFNRNARKKTGFADFLSADYVGDYITQDLPYEKQIERAAGFLREADFVLLGAGAGMSAAAGAQYGGRFFEENFGEFQKAYAKGPCIPRASIPSPMRRVAGATGPTWR